MEGIISFEGIGNLFIMLLSLVSLGIIVYINRHSLKSWLTKESSGSGYGLFEVYARNLNALALSNELDPVIGRDDEIEKIIRVLSRRTKNNVILVGRAGVGKTAMAEGLAMKIVKKEVPPVLYNKRVFDLNIGALVAGTKYRGEFEERLNAIKNAIVNSNRTIILFIDEIHNLVKLGEAEGGIAAAEILKPALARGELQVVGATTFDDFGKIQKDLTFMRRFQPVVIKEPGAKETLKILAGLKKKYEDHHGVIIPDKLLEFVIDAAIKYFPARAFPDKAIDLIDEASSKVALDYATRRRKDNILKAKDINLIARERFENETGV